MGGRCTSLVYTGVILLCVAPSQAATVYVDSRASTCGDGQSWATAYKYLQDALTAARSSGGTITEIWVAAGTYQPDRTCANPAGSRSRTTTFQLINGVALLGGFSGNEDPATFNLADRDFVSNKTILSGDLADDDGPSFANNGENAYHVVTGSTISATARIDGFTIVGGNANNMTLPDYIGGGMYNTGTPTVANCTFNGNSALAGGGMYSEGNPTITNCTFSGNSAPNGGGGMCNDGNPTMTNCTFSGNSALDHGGGILSEGSPTLTNCSFENNIVSENTYSTGGGMSSWYGAATLTRCSFVGNESGVGTASGDGGGLFIYGDGNKIVDCSFIGNSSSDDGGGLHIKMGSAMLTNCEFRGNWSYDGGGMEIYDSNVTLANCTFTGNSGPDETVFCVDGGTLAAGNCIVWGNSGMPIRLRGGGLISITYSCIQGGWAGEGNISSDPLFVSAAAGDLRLGNGSPCIDAGNNAAVPANILTDILGFSRFFDDPNVADCQWLPGMCGTAPIVDMGAYESNGLPPPTITQQPVAQTICKGGTATFTAAASGTGTLSYQWQKDKVNLSDDGHYFGVTTNTLTVTAAISADNGNYRCIITDTNGSTPTGEASLIVKPLTTIYQQPTNATGTPATFTVAATGDGTLAYQWQKNGINLTDDVHYTGTKTPTLTVAYCACGDTNTYRCVVTGGCTVAISEPAALICQPGDSDGDSDVDQEDFGSLQTCLSSDISAVPACKSMDLNGDEDIDIVDVTRFIGCMSGPNVAGNPSCGQ